MALAIKHRPPTLTLVAGNDETILAIESKLAQPREEFPHAILLTGPSGCGKTTLARIIATALGCGDSDYHERDSAACRSIEDVREIRERMWMTPIDGDVTVYLLDEVHMLGQGGASEKNPAQNALLKALEDAPPHVYFILATTSPEMLIPAVKTRCMVFDVKPLDDETMTGFLRSIVSKERKRVPPEVLEQITLTSFGSCRQALQTLDKIIDLPIDNMLSMVDKAAAQENKVIDLCRSIMARGSWSKIAAVLKGLEKETPESIRQAVCSYCANTLLSGKDVAQAWLVLDAFKDPFYGNDARARLVHAAYLALESVQPQK